MTLQHIKDAAERVDTLQKNLHEAERLIERIQAGEDFDVGAWVVIGDELHVGNRSDAFDDTFWTVIKAHFPELARETLTRMAQAYHSALIAEKDHLKDALTEVERAEADAARVNPYSDVNQKNCSTEHSHA